MASHSNQNQPLVAILDPTTPLKICYRKTKNSPRHHGSHRLNYRSPAKSAASCRKYIKGDPIKLIDWKAYARTDQILLRERRKDASSNIVILIDYSASMLWPDTFSQPYLPKDCPTKLELALRIAFNLAYFYLGTGDSVKLLLWDRINHEPSPTKSIPCPSGADILILFDHLATSGFKESDIAASLVPLKAKLAKSDQLYWLSDGLSEIDYAAFSTNSKKVSFLHLLTSLETDIDWVENEICYYDNFLKNKEYLGSALLHKSEKYRVCIDNWRDKMRKDLLSHNISYQFITDKTPISRYQHELVLNL